MKQMIIGTQPKNSIDDTALWRPLNSIRTKVVGIAQHEKKMLVCEVLNDQGLVKGWCPLGGGIEFCETAEDALKREIFEELGCNILIKSGPIFCENIFEHQGIKGHEIVLAFVITYDDPQIYAKKRFQICESNGSMHWVEWIDIVRFQSGEATLFPLTLPQQIF